MSRCCLRGPARVAMLLTGPGPCRDAAYGGPLKGLRRAKCPLYRRLRAPVTEGQGPAAAVKGPRCARRRRPARAVPGPCRDAARLYRLTHRRSMRRGGRRCRLCVAVCSRRYGPAGAVRMRYVRAYAVCKRARRQPRVGRMWLHAACAREKREERAERERREAREQSERREAGEQSTARAPHVTASWCRGA